LPRNAWRRCWRLLVRGWEASAQRRALARLDETALKDLGLSQADVEREVRRPFWEVDGQE
jgi:uncharacterized protein YjiS (DUF1127 family)